MTKPFNFTHLLAFALLSATICQANAGSEDAADMAPTASAEEARIRHWREPAIERNFWDITELEKAYISTAPTHMNDGIAVGALGRDGGNLAVLTSLTQEIAEKQHAEVDSLLVAHKGKLLLESYFARGRVNLSHPQSSTTKSYTALALGRAIQLGHLSMADLNKPLISFLKGLDTSNLAKGAENITLHQALNMRSGLVLSEEQMQVYRENPEQYAGLKQAQAYLKDTAPLSGETHPFSYQGPNPDLVMQVLDAVVPGTARDFINNELLKKLGIVNYDWRSAPNGLPASGSFSSFTARDMLKFGSVIMNQGQWNGEQLVSSAFLSAAIDKQVALSDEQVSNFYSGANLSNSGYGYFFWQTDMQVGDKRFTAHSAQGGGGVTILLIEELELLVVVTAHSRQAYLQMIAEKVLPAFI